MKKLSIAFIMVALTLVAMAQDNKPTQGAFGIGYGVSVMPFGQSVGFTYLATDQIEVGGTINLAFMRNRNSTFDSGTVIGAGTSGILLSRTESKTVTSSTSFGITPLVKYHFKTKNNLDVYTGGAIPIGVSTGTKTVTSNIVTADNYNQNASITTTGPINVSVGAAVLLGCQYFFYQHLCIGLQTQLGFIASMADGNNTTTSALTNSGSNNPEASVNPAPVVTKAMVKNETQSLGMLHAFDISVSWYFGGGGKK
jgi:hypothetical protein